MQQLYIDTWLDYFEVIIIERMCGRWEPNEPGLILIFDHLHEFFEVQVKDKE